MPTNYEELTIRDKFMFGKITQDPDNAQILLSALLNEDITVETSEAERHTQHLKKRKFVRFDLFARDTEKNVYDAEMQNYSANRERQQELPWRVRYYQCMLDGELLDSRVSYRQINDTYVIFICDFDPFGKGYYRYTVVPKCLEDDTIDYKDGTTRIFFNLCGDLTQAPESVKNMMEYFKDGKVSDAGTQILDNAVNRGRENEEWRSDYMLKALYDSDMYDDGYQEGKAKGKAEQLIELVRMKMLDVKDAAKVAGISEEEFRMLI